MSIDLKVSEIDPPSIVMDVVNLPDPVYLGFTITAYNYDAVNLYFRITGSGTGWTFTTVDLGLINSGTNKRQNLDDFCHRARPASETSEQIQLILRAYTDAGYTDLKWTFTKTIDVWWIKSDDGSWTEDLLNNFDDGTLQGWAQSGLEAFAVATDYVLSTPYSARMNDGLGGGSGTTTGYMYKSVNTADRNNVIWIVDARIRVINGVCDYLNLQNGATILVTLGGNVPEDKWLRLIALLPKNTSVELRIFEQITVTLNGYCYINVDDIRIISKD